MTAINVDQALELVHELVDRVLGSENLDPSDDDTSVSVNVTRGYDRKGYRTSRDVDSAPGPYSDGDDDTVVVEVLVGSEQSVCPVRGHGVFLPWDHNGPAVRLRIELGPKEPLAQQFLEQADKVVADARRQRLIELNAQKTSIQAEIDALTTRSDAD